MDAMASPGGSLGEIDERQTRDLYASLWEWNLCTSCCAGLDTACDTFSCPSHRINQLGPFNDLYRESTSRYLPEFTASRELALRNHDDLIELIRFIRGKTTIPRHQLTADYFAERARRENRDEQPDIHDQERAISLAGRILTMVSFLTESKHAEALIEEGSRLVTWTSTDSLTKFVSRSFPTTDHPSLNDPNNQATKSAGLKLRLEARRLSKIAGLTFRKTDNLADHLRLDVREGCVSVFHHTTALKEFLISTRTDESGISSKETCLPRQLALEVIDSIQKILFPLGSESELILRSLVVKQGLDPDCLRFVDSSPYRRANENDIPYHYFGGRLMDLAHELDHPTPRTTWEMWLERKNGARYVMLATLAGVLVAILLGFMALIVSIFQAWVSWQAWKYLVSSG